MGTVVKVDAHWDARAKVWIASSKNVVNFAIEAPSLYKLRKRLPSALDALVGPMENKIRFRLVAMPGRHFGDRFLDV